MALDKLALIAICVLAALWLAVWVFGLVATFPFGLPVIVVLLGAGYFLYRVVRDRLNNAEDDYYERNVKQ